MSMTEAPATPAPAPATRRFRWPNSLRFRLLFGGALWIALALAVTGVVLSDLFADQVRHRMDVELIGHLNQLAAALREESNGRVVVAHPLSDPRFRRPLSGLYWQMEAPPNDGARSRSLWDGAIPLAPDELSEGDLHHHRLRGPGGGWLMVLERRVTLAEEDRRVRIAVAVDEREFTDATAAFNRTLTLSLAALWLSLTAAALVQVSVGLRPLARLHGHLAAVRDGRTRRLPEDQPSEISPLAREMNAVLDHDDAVVTRARLQAGNLAHALKTDLAVLANEAAALENAGALDRGEASDGDGAHAARIEGLVGRMTRQIDHHMARASAAASAGVPGQRAPVGPAVERLVRTMSRLHTERGLAFSHAIPCALTFSGDEQDLLEMLGNLLDNACKWAEGRVDVTARAVADGMLEITVEDDGPGLPEEARAMVPKSGVRLDQSTPGNGLGLAVVVDLAEMYGGALELGDAALGGLSARLRLPAR